MIDRAPDALVLPAHPKILVVTLRRLGDVLLTTPLLRTLRRGFPDAQIDMLVFRGSDGILNGNPDIGRVFTASNRAGLFETIGLLAKLWRRYDLVVSTQEGDRPTFMAMIAGRRRVGIIPHRGSGAWWKRHVHDRPVRARPGNHRVDELLRLTDALGLPRDATLVPPRGATAEAVAPAGPYAVIHATPMYRYKRWSDDGWRALACGLADRGLTVVASEGPDPDERAYLDALWSGIPVVRVGGRLGWDGLADLLRRAAVYIGPDTSVSHLAAAAGCPTIALFGATSPRLIGPWPTGGLDRPWDEAGTIQQRGNVFVLQNPLPCVPCDRLGCDRHLESVAICLEELPAEQVLAAVDRALAMVPAAKPRYADAMNVATIASTTTMTGAGTGPSGPA